MATARTSAESADLRLAGRTYTIPFALVWEACLDLVRGELSHWYARWWDEEVGVIQALSRAPVSRRVSDVVIRIRLDEQAQTRVDMRATSRFTVVGDLGSNARLISTFTSALDRKLIAPPTPPVLIVPEVDGPATDGTDESASQPGEDAAAAPSGPPDASENGEPGSNESRDSGRDRSEERGADRSDTPTPDATAASGTVGPASTGSD